MGSICLGGWGGQPWWVQCGWDGLGEQGDVLRVCVVDGDEVIADPASRVLLVRVNLVVKVEFFWEEFCSIRVIESAPS